MENIQVRANGLDFGHIGWKYYNSIRKKAMEQEFSWSGLVISLSIAFFIVIMTALLLNLAHQNLGFSQPANNLNRDKIYYLEAGGNNEFSNYMQTEVLQKDRWERIVTCYTA